MPTRTYCQQLQIAQRIILKMTAIIERDANSVDILVRIQHCSDEQAQERRSGRSAGPAAPADAAADAIIGTDGDDGSIRPAARHAARVGDRSLQPALRLLHAGDGIRLAAAGRPADLRGNRSARLDLRVAGRGTRAPHRRRAAAPPGSGRPRGPARRADPASRNARSRPTASTWRRRRRRCGRLASIASPSASTRWSPSDSCACHARGTSTRSSPASRPPRPRSARSSSIPSSSAARTTTSCRRSSSTPDASARKSASSNTWTSAARRTGPPPAWCPGPRSWPGSSARSAR